MISKVCSVIRESRSFLDCYAASVGVQYCAARVIGSNIDIAILQTG